MTAYDGDRVMAVFVGDSPNTAAAKCGLKINYLVTHIINPSITAQYGQNSYVVKQVVGVDSSDLFVARTGVRGDNDLVWVGQAANYAAKLSEISNDDATFITESVYKSMHESAKNGGEPSRPMWRARVWNAMGGVKIYSSNWWWAL